MMNCSCGAQDHGQSYRNQENIEYRINFFAAGFIDTVHIWLEKKNRSPREIAGFLLEMLRQVRM